MSSFTYAAAPAIATGAATRMPLSVKLAQPKSFWARLFDRVIEARIHQAERVLARHGFPRPDPTVSK